MDYGRTLQRLESLCLGSSTSVLDGVPFKIGPKFIPPSKVIIPPDLQHKTHALEEEEYSFAIETGVLEWAEERKRQQDAQREAEEKLHATDMQQYTQENSDSDASGDIDPWVVGSSNAFPSTTEVNITEPTKNWPNPLLAGFSNNILEPTPINHVNGNEKKEDESVKQPIDIALFDKEEDVFDNVEMQTIDVLDELKTVFQSSVPDKPDVNTVEEAAVTNPNEINNQKDDCDVLEKVAESNLSDVNDGNTRNNLDYDNPCVVNEPHLQTASTAAGDLVDGGDYVDLYREENRLETGESLDLSNNEPLSAKLPFLATHDCCPPINSNVEANSKSDSLENETTDVPSSTHNEQNVFRSDKSSEYENVSIPSGFSGVKYSRLGSSPDPSSYVNVSPFQKNGYTEHLSGAIRNTRSTPDLTLCANSENSRNEKLSPLPTLPLKPSHQQSCNQYQPLPPTWQKKISPASDSDSNEDLSSPSEIDPYLRLNLASKNSVDHLVAMGFSKPRAGRAIEKLCNDEKEAIEHMCLVDKLTDRGYNPYLAETALLLFDNNLKKAKSYLDIQQQFQTLGFSQEQIKEALITHNCDRDKALDYLTT